jgi:hypothetical protein
MVSSALIESSTRLLADPTGVSNVSGSVVPDGIIMLR